MWLLVQIIAETDKAQKNLNRFFQMKENYKQGFVVNL